VLIGAASKNDPSLVEDAFRRTDSHLPAERIFPMEVHWGPKSESVARILKTWNIGADAVVFVDDSPMDLVEVQASHPDVECFRFPKDDPGAVRDLLEQLRELFGKSSVSEEDRIRSRSIRSAVAIRDAVRQNPISYEEVLKQSQASIDFRLAGNGRDDRAFELVNKTSQFNLNGRRYSKAEWQNYFRQQHAFLLTASYQDKFRPLGEIAAVLGRISRMRNSESMLGS
jgi:FkbH-like protein